VARGGTGISSIAVNSIPYATSTNVIGTSTNLTYDTTDNILGNPTILSFKSNPGGGSGYNASIKYWYYSGQNSYLMLSTNGSSSEHIYLNSSGNVQIGNSPIFPDANTGSYKLNVVGSIYSSGGFTTGGTISSGNNNISCGTGNITCGNVNASGDVTAAFTSDDRLKIKTDLIDKPIEKINSLTAFKYTYNDLAKSLGLSNEKVQIGLSAQDVQKVLPEAIRIANFDMDFENNKSKSGNNYLAIDYVRLVPLLIEAIKEQQKTIDEINSKLNSLLVQ
ncbi:tail fiber domain-containing protein, partial [bacterium]|nr:tail fiber domain-containing protein [bacterium]